MVSTIIENVLDRRRIETIVSSIVTVHPHEMSALIHSSTSFFFILSAYFVVLPLRDEGAISLGLTNLPELFVGSLLLTLVAAPVSTLIFSLPNLSKVKALVLIHRFFSLSLVIFFFLWHSSSPGYSSSASKTSVSLSPNAEGDQTTIFDQGDHAHPSSWGDHGWFYISVRIGLFLWVALLNLITISSTWARVIDVMDNESGSRLFGFIGAGATLGQLFGSLFAAGMAWLGPSDLDEEAEDQRQPAHTGSSPKSSIPMENPQLWVMLDGLRLIISSSYLLYVALFLWLSALVSSFFYFQKVTVIALTVASPLDRRRLFAQINSFIAVFILAGQLTMTGRILTIAGVTTAICSSPVVAFSNIIAIALQPTWIVVAVSETLRKVVTYVVSRPGRELLFTVVSREEKYKAKVCIDVIVQRLGDATAAGIYKLLLSNLNGRVSTVPLYALPVCLLWIGTAFHLGRRQSYLAKLQSTSIP
ncbi:hypothetical protein ACHQM5_020503 [Ranunculus cassubicifolius]